MTNRDRWTAYCSLKSAAMTRTADAYRFELAALAYDDLISPEQKAEMVEHFRSLIRDYEEQAAHYRNNLDVVVEAA